MLLDVFANLIHILLTNGTYVVYNLFKTNFFCAQVQIVTLRMRSGKEKRKNLIDLFFYEPIIEENQDDWKSNKAITTLTSREKSQ